VSGIDGRFFDGVCKLDGALLVGLNVQEVLSSGVDAQTAAAGS